LISFLVVILFWIRIRELLKEFYHRRIGNCKGCGFGNSLKIHRLAELRLRTN